MLNISLPNQIIDFIEQQAIADGFNTPSEYVFHLILVEGLDSGVATEITDDLMRDQLRERLKEGAIARAARDLSLVQE
jgi:Arc/MetJ-type ribon-helix-helix transcriptional regulator